MTTVTIATFPSASEIGKTVKRTKQILAKRSDLERQLADRREHVRDLIAAWVGGTNKWRRPSRLVRKLSPQIPFR